MRIVIAPDKFKGSLDAAGVARAVADGIRAVRHDAAVDLVPVADGGEGTLDAALGAGFERRTTVVSGPTGAPVAADWGLRGDEAVIEMALASGLGILPGGIRDARGATSRGTGELIAAALDAGARRIVLGVGGSAGTDGGAGMLQALGLRLLDGAGAVLPGGGAALARLVTVDASAFDPRLAEASLTLATDVDNPLLGPNGAAAVFGPQKGATPEDVAELDAALARYVALIADAFGVPGAADAPGAGAAGGVGFAAVAALGAERRSGVDVVLDFTGLRERLVGADLVVTGEGSIDEQSLGGKTPVGVARAARAIGVPVVAVCGRTTLDDDRLRAAGFVRTWALAAREPDPEVSMRDAARLLREIGAELAASLPVGDGAVRAETLTESITS
ncbi:glycerate kinase [Microbacterium sp. NEAU-LLC]|uniref:Glycerate kinase n=1 Tax=Microbacterium helvum TaxID=2773713 RepID=A0ABR8NQ82_9MICO|nr:glycerate kinase [Microbacterium helvum]MBD3942789.1 glycerate kinase [Microbacterium helvum]